MEEQHRSEIADVPVGAAGARLPRRAVVVGTTGSGKSVLARRLAAIIGGRHVELDALYHGPGWQPAEIDVFRKRVADAIDAPCWVVDGGYASLVYDIAWRAADTVVWLDYPFPLVMWRLLRRTFVRRARNEELWNGNRESLRKHFMSRESLFLWASRAHWKYRRSYPEWFRRRELAHLNVVRLHTPAETERYVRQLEAIASR